MSTGRSLAVTPYRTASETGVPSPEAVSDGAEEDQAVLQGDPEDGDEPDGRRDAHVLARDEEGHEPARQGQGDVHEDDPRLHGRSEDGVEEEGHQEERQGGDDEKGPAGPLLELELPSPTERIARRGGPSLGGCPSGPPPRNAPCPGPGRWPGPC